MNGSVSSVAPPTPRASVRKHGNDAEEATFVYYAKMFTYLIAWSTVSGLLIILSICVPVSTSDTTLDDVGG